MAHQRDYKAEYARRIARGIDRGVSRSQARGHPRATERLVSGKVPTATFVPHLEEGVRLVRSGKSLSSSSKSIHVAPERLRNYMLDQGIAEKSRGKWRVGTDQRLRKMLLFSDKKSLTVVVRGYDAAREVGEYMSAVNRFLATNDISELAPYKEKFTTDVEGKRYYFETRPNILYRLNSTNSTRFEQVYRIIV